MSDNQQQQLGQVQEQQPTATTQHPQDSSGRGSGDPNSRTPPHLIEMEVHKEIIPDDDETVARTVTGFDKDHWKVIH